MGSQVPNVESDQRPPLQSPKGPAGLFPAHLAKGNTVLVLKAPMSWKKTPFVITTTDKTPILQCVGHDMFNKKQVILDGQGNHLVRLNSKVLPYIAEDAGGNELVRLSNAGRITPKLQPTYLDHFTGLRTELSLVGPLSGDVLDIVAGDKPIARYRKKWDGRDTVHGAATTWLEVAQDVDIVLMAVICISIDEFREAQRKARNKISHESGPGRLGTLTKSSMTF